jgi:hypothetical protein
LEATAYTWFNRFAAIRFMGLQGYLDLSFRVLSHPGGSVLPEILEKNLFGLDIDGRAAQSKGFAMMMKGLADDRRLLDPGGGARCDGV